jgi:hypothetical protein
MALDDAFPGRVWFVAHAIREIRNRLPDALAGEVATSRTDYPGLTAEVHLRWVEEGLPVEGGSIIDPAAEPSAAGLGRREVSGELLRAVSELITGHLAVSENNESRARRLFEAIGGDPPPQYVVRAWLRGRRWAEAHAHVRNAPLAEKDEEDLVGQFLDFEQALNAIASRSYQNMDALDEILGEANR